MKIKNIMLFGYNFPHKKTQDFIFRLLIENYNIKYVIAAPWKKLNIPRSAIRISPEHVGLVHPKSIFKKFNIKLIVSRHNSQETINFLKKNPVDLYIISGARILTKEVIESTKNKIFNIHPGLLPQVRGLDTLLWSIYFNKPLGMTAHFISKKIDSGLLIYKEKLLLKLSDTISDVSLRLLEEQTEVLIRSLKRLKSSKISELQNLDLKKAVYNTKMPQYLEKKTITKFPLWLKKFAKY